jgi:hypothetical protein
MKAKLISFVIASAPKFKKGEEVEAKAVQSAPQYYESAFPKQFLIGEETKKIANREIKFLIKSYLPDMILVETSVDVEDVFSDETYKLRKTLVDTCQKIIKSQGGRFDLSEEYSIALIYDYAGEPEQFFNRRTEMAAFLKSEKLPLDEKEIEYTLSKQIKYGKDDLVIIDWDGAFVFDTSGQIDDIIDLLQTANLQLLRYRTLDFELDTQLRKVTKFAKADTKILFRKELTKAFRAVIEVRGHAIADFEAIERDIKLIGDWYSARLYDLVSKKFKIDEWRKLVQDKLESLEDIYNIVAENFSISRHQFLEIIQIILFFILQAGWFTLIILEFIYFTR